MVFFFFNFYSLLLLPHHEEIVSLDDYYGWYFFIRHLSSFSFVSVNTALLEDILELFSEMKEPLLSSMTTRSLHSNFTSEHPLPSDIGGCRSHHFLIPNALCIYIEIDPRMRMYIELNKKEQEEVEEGAVENDFGAIVLWSSTYRSGQTHLLTIEYDPHPPRSTFLIRGYHIFVGLFLLFVYLVLFILSLALFLGSLAGSSVQSIVVPGCEVLIDFIWSTSSWGVSLSASGILSYQNLPSYCTLYEVIHDATLSWITEEFQHSVSDLRSSDISTALDVYLNEDKHDILFSGGLEYTLDSSKEPVHISFDDSELFFFFLNDLGTVRYC